MKEKQAPCRICDGVHCGQPVRGFYPLYHKDEFGGEHEAMQMCRFEKARRAQEKIDRLMKGSCLPPYLADKTWPDFEAKGASLDAARRMAQVVGEGTVSNGLYIFGPKGTGKTMLAALIAKDRINAGEPTMFVFVPELLGKYRAYYRDDTMDDPAEIAKDAKLLILDDIGAERATSWVAEQLMELVNYRYSNRLQTIFTSNYSLKELADHLATGGDQITGDRIVSRIIAMTIPVPVFGEDKRGTI